MNEFLSDVEYWQSKALEQQMRALKAETETAALGMQMHSDNLYAKYGLTKGADRFEERDGKIVIVRAPKADIPAQVLEAVK